MKYIAVRGCNLIKFENYFRVINTFTRQWDGSLKLRTALITLQFVC